MKQKIISKVPLAVFRKWNNKHYAVFNSLKRVIKIGCLLVAYLKFASPLAFAASPDTTSVSQNYELESIDISADQLPETFSSLSRVVVTVTQKEIERAAVTSLNELLEFTSSIDLRQRGANSVQSDISIRGSSFDQVLILLNGVNITDPQTGHHNLNLPLDLSAIERIEVVKGPGSWKYGPGAYGGAVNFITRNGVSPFLQANIEGGQYATHKETLAAGIRTGNVSHFLTANYASSDGYTDNTDFKIKSFYYQGALKSDDGNLSFQAGYSDRNFGANSFYSAKYPNQFEETEAFFSSIEGKYSLKKFQIETKSYLRRHNDHFLLFRNNPSLYNNYHTTDIWGGNFQLNYFHSTKSVTSFGADYRTETIWSNRLGELMDNPVKSPANDSIVLNYSHSRSNFSSFIGYKHYFSKLVINVGLNLTRNTDQQFKWFIYPGFDLSYNLSGKSTLLASANKTMRMPTFTDLYYTSPSNEGNPDLAPEKATGYELGYRFANNFMSISSSIFYSEGKNLIDWVKSGSDDIWHTINYTKINTYGAELSTKVELDKLLTDQKILKQIKINYTYLSQDKPKTDLISNYSLNYLKHRADLAIDHLIWKNISAQWNLTWQDRDGKYEKYENGSSLGVVEYEPFFLCDAKVSWQNRGWRVYAMVNNLFGIQYYDIGNISQPGRWFKIGLSKRIDFN